MRLTYKLSNGWQITIEETEETFGPRRVVYGDRRQLVTITDPTGNEVEPAAVEQVITDDPDALDPQSEQDSPPAYTATPVMVAAQDVINTLRR